MQNSNNVLNNASKKFDLYTDINKTKTIRHNDSTTEEIIIDGHQAENTDSFIYLGTIISASGSIDEDITKRLMAARRVCGRLSKVWVS